MKATGNALQLAPHFSRLYGVLRSAFAGFGLLAAAAFVMAGLHRDALLQELRHIADEALAVPAVSAAAPLQAAIDHSAAAHEQRALAEHIGRRWRIADSAAAHFVAIAHRAGEQHSVDPALILAVMAVESAYNPVAQSSMGAVGLMQVIPKYHLEKLADHGGEQALLDPEVNIHVGAQILREYYRRFGELEAALQMYAGAFDDPAAQYTAKVLAELGRLEPVRRKARLQSGRSA